MTAAASFSTRSKRARHVVISAGPTREPIDPVRFISNYSTGTMGARVAHEALRRGYRVTLVSGPTECPPPSGARLIRIETAQHMHAALHRVMPAADALVMAAAVCDFRSARIASRKLARHGWLRLNLEPTLDIVASLPRRAGQVFIGFALETHEALAHAREKLRRKRLDCIVGQTLTDTDKPFGDAPVQAFVARASGSVSQFGRISKAKLACVILDEIEQLWYRDMRPRKARHTPRRRILLTSQPTR